MVCTKNCKEYLSVLFNYIAEALREDLLSSSIPDIIRQLSEHDDEKVKTAAKSVIPVLEDTQPVDR